MLVKDLPLEIRMNTRFYDSLHTIAISDVFVVKHRAKFMSVDVYSNELGNLKKGFNYYGITIYTPEMAEELKKTFIGAKPTKSQNMIRDYEALMDILDRAIDEQVYLVHLGI